MTVMIPLMRRRFCNSGEREGELENHTNNLPLHARDVFQVSAYLGQ
jgi:hypothetical protein